MLEYPLQWEEWLQRGVLGLNGSQVPEQLLEPRWHCDSAGENHSAPSFREFVPSHRRLEHALATEFLRFQHSVEAQFQIGSSYVELAKQYPRVWLDPRKMKQRGVTTDEVVAAIAEQNVQVAAGHRADEQFHRVAPGEHR